MTITDPIARYAAGAIIVCTFLAALVVATHGYLTDANYQPPQLISYVLASAVTGSLTLLGVHVGTVNAASTAANTAAQTTAAAAQAVKEGNGVRV